MKKHSFLTLFGERRIESSKNAVFRIYYELCTKCLEKCEKHCFLTHFGEHHAKSSKNAVFSHICEHCKSVSKKNKKKTLFFYTLCGTSGKKLDKRRFSHFVLSLYKVSQKVKNTVFSHNSRKLAQKVQKTLCFPIFCEFRKKCLEKREETLFSHTFWGTSCKKLEKRCFFRIFCELCSKFLEKREKTLFSHHFCGTSRKKRRKRFFFDFVCKLCTKCLG